MMGGRMVYKLPIGLAYNLLNLISLAIYYYLVDKKYKYIGFNNFSSIFLYITCV